MKISKKTLLLIIAFELIIAALIFGYIKRDSFFKTETQADNEKNFKSQKLYVKTYSGLAIRFKPGSSQDKIGILPYGSEVELIEKSNIKEIIDSYDGIWFKVKYDNTFLGNRKSGYKEGWCFSSFLTESPQKFKVPFGAIAGTNLQKGKSYEWSIDKVNMTAGKKEKGAIILFSSKNTVSQTNRLYYYDVTEDLRGTYRFDNGIVSVYFREKDYLGQVEFELNQNIITDFEFLCAETTTDHLLVRSDGEIFFIKK